MINQNLLSFIKSVFLLQLFIIIIIFGLSIDLSCNSINNISFPVFSQQTGLFMGSKINENIAQEMISRVNTAMAGNTDAEHLSWEYIGSRFAENMFTTSINALAYSRGSDNNIKSAAEETSDIQLPAIKLETEEEVSQVLKEFSGDSKAFFYCTHSAESYIPDSGKAKLDGSRGLVNNVASHMADVLGQKGLAAAYINTIHDWPEYNKSYTNSRDTVKQIMDSGEDKILALFDVHRDSIPGLDGASTITIDGKKSAVILIVVGTDERKEHPHWRENLSFAQRLYEQAELMYPGLIKGVRTKAGTYNQEYHNRALLLEMGSDYNSLEEAKYAGELFTNVLVKVLEKEVE